MSTLPTFDAPRLLSYLTPLLNAALVVLIGLTTAQLFWAAWPMPSAPILPAVAAKNNHATPRAEVDIEQITAAHLFGRRSEPGDDIPGIDAPETQLDLILTGIVADTRGDGSWALISEGKAEQHAYTVGDAIADNVNVHAIHWNRVVLDRHGQFETLTLEIDREEGVRETIRQEKPVNISKQLGTFRDEVTAEPALLSKYLTIRAARKNGQVEGVRIFPTNESREIFAEAGLKPGELVTMVNGIALDRSLDMAFLTKELRDARRFTLSLKRRGQERTVTIALD